MFTNAAFCLPLLFWTGAQVDRADWPRFLLVGMIGNFGYYVGSNFGFANLSAGAGGMIYATNPLIIAALAAALGVERLSPAVILGLLISFRRHCYLFADGIEGTGANPIFGGIALLLACACLGRLCRLCQAADQEIWASESDPLDHRHVRASGTGLLHQPDACTSR